MVIGPPGIDEVAIGQARLGIQNGLEVLGHGVGLGKLSRCQACRWHGHNGSAEKRHLPHHGIDALEDLLAVDVTKDLVGRVVSGQRGSEGGGFIKRSVFALGLTAR